VTGVSGLQRERAWVALQNAKVQDIGHTMLDIAAQRGIGLNENNILHAGYDTLAALRAAAVARILAENRAVETPSTGLEVEC
jgi:hypothetical protein